MKTTQPNCVYCGRFISWKQYVTWTPYGTALDLEPPDDEFMCKPCWDKLSEKDQERYRTWEWHPAVVVEQETV